MRVVLLEYVTATTPSRRQPLARAGRAMRDAVLADLLDLPDVAVLLIHHETERPPAHPRLTGLSAGNDPEAALGAAARRMDAALIIAPETGGLLARLCGVVERTGCLLLGPSSAAVRLATDKALAARILRAAGAPAPATRIVRFADAGHALARAALPIVLKPRDGCGGAGVAVARRRAEVPAAIRHVRAATARADFIVQGLIAGVPASVSLIAGGAATGRILVLGAARQRLRGSRFPRYTGGEVPLAPGGDPASAAMTAAARAAAVAAARALASFCRRHHGAGAGRPRPGDLRGFLGVDLVTGDSGGAMVIEINPRLTTSYIGLRHVLRENLAELILRASRGGRLPVAVTSTGACRFEAGGRVAGSRPWVRGWTTTSAGTSAARI